MEATKNQIETACELIREKIKSGELAGQSLTKRAIEKVVIHRSIGLVRGCYTSLSAIAPTPSTATLHPRLVEICLEIMIQ